ncbi:hypothetical protein R3P38DRAFT_3227008 [Favolaschia claudopus]|uniref:Rhamnogalacturonase B N-terminal domain-containing protein n=1 Tax=Favolaschia claudopus TaxID=2862362 RepID=A0AAV9ZSR5_9AGAR
MFGRGLLLLSSVLSLAVPLVSGLGVAVSGTLWTATTDGGLVFTVQSTNGNITSMVYNGIQAQDQSKHGQIITCTTSTLTQYYVAQRNTPAIHMAST